MNIFSTIVQNFKELMGDLSVDISKNSEVDVSAKLKEMKTSKYRTKLLLRFILLIQFVLLPLMLITYLQIKGTDVEFFSDKYFIEFTKNAISVFVIFFITKISILKHKTDMKNIEKKYKSREDK